MKKKLLTLNNLYMGKFNTGDKVIALSSKDCNKNPRQKGKEYKVIGVMECPECSEEFICINDKQYSNTLRIKCAACSCSNIYSNHMWTLASNFRSKDQFDPHYELKIAIKDEDYMRAAKLRDIINSDCK
jgi:hypothetical protein